MAADTTAFDVDAGESEEQRRERLRRELSELDEKPVTETEVLPSDGEPLVADVDEEFDREEAEAAEKRKKREARAFMWKSPLTGREMKMYRPTDVAVSMFIQTLKSKVLDRTDQMGRMGDFCRRHADEADYADWEETLLIKAEDDPDNASIIMFTEVNRMLDALYEHATQTDDKKFDEAVNRERKRAAAKAKKQRLESGAERSAG